MTGLIQDLRYALRQLRKSPRFAAVVILTLALGIGANTAIFSMVDAALLRSWPAKEPSRLVQVVAKSPQGMEGTFSYPDYRDLAEQSKSLEGILAYSRHGQFLRVGTETRQLLDDVVSPNYFSVLEIDMQLGHAFQAESDAGSGPVVVISDALWHRAFNGDPSLVGKEIWLTDKNFTVIGIAPPHFRGLETGVPTDLWIPVTAGYGMEDRNIRDKQLLARLRADTTPAQAQTEIGILGRRLAGAYPEVDKARDIILVSESERLKQAAAPSAMIMSAVGLILLICCANVAGLMLARSEARRREIAVRLAIGAGRGRLIRQLLTESAVLSLAGAAVGLLLAFWFFHLQPALMPPMGTELGLDLRMDAPVLAFTAVLSLLTIMAFGLLPALQTTKPDVVSVLKGKGPVEGRSFRRFLARNALTLGEIAVSIVLLTASGLLVRSLLFTRSLNHGFDQQKKLIFVNLNPRFAGYEGDREPIYLDNVEQRLAGLPGVRQVSYANRALLSGSGGGLSARVAIPGFELPQAQPNVPIKFNGVGPGYFRIMGTRLLEGRDFSSEDSRLAPAVVVISQNMARRFWPEQDAIGRMIVVEGTKCQIVGVAEDATINQIHEPPEPYMYFPFAQRAGTDATIMVATASDPRAVVATIRREILKMNPEMIIYDIQTMHSLMQQALWMDSMAAGLAVVLGALGTLLAALGLYGVIAYLVSKRQREIGIRMAMGAESGNVLRMVLGQGLRIAAVGAGTGLAASLGIMRLLASMLYGVKPTDAVSYLGSATVVILVTAAATYFPARRAAKVDPMVALRYE